jgi:hypothetical protein
LRILCLFVLCWRFSINWCAFGLHFKCHNTTRLTAARRP